MKTATLFRLEETEEEILARLKLHTDHIREVFSHWRKYHPSAFTQPHSKLKEWVKIRQRFEDGYSVAQLCRAIDGIHRSRWHNGENPGNTKYVSLELCLRDAKHVEQFLGIADQPDQPLLSEKTQRTVRALEQWANRGGEIDDDGITE